MEFEHPYSRYGLALVMHENGLNVIGEVKNKQLRNELIRGLGHFRIKPSELFEGKEEVGFDYMSYDYLLSNPYYQSRGKPDEGIYLSPNIIATDQSARLTWSGTKALISQLENEKSGKENLTMSIAAISAKFNNGKKSQSYPKASTQEVGCAAITNTTPYKPCLAYKKFEKGKWNRTNTTVIPDLPLTQMIKFISLFKMMILSDSSKNLMQGNVSHNTVGKGKNSKEVFSPWRPRIFNGNFPNPPQSSALGSVALLGSIGEWSKKAGLWDDGREVLDSLVDVPLYLVSCGNAKSFTYNHYIIDLAKENKLNRIVDAVYYTKLFNTTNRSQNKTEFQSFDLFASRFLQLFDRPSFKDFLSFRAEYPSQLKILFITYFTKMEKINIKTVRSAKELGRWLNYVAYIAAKNDKDNRSYDDLKKAKAKVLIEIESSVFSAKTGDALIAQVITRAGRLSQMDAPPEADFFIEQTCSSDLPLDNAKNLLMAFSRLRSKYEKPAETEDENKEDDNTVDTSEFEEN